MLHHMQNEPKKTHQKILLYHQKVIFLFFNHKLQMLIKTKKIN